MKRFNLYIILIKRLIKGKINLKTFGDLIKDTNRLYQIPRKERRLKFNRYDHSISFEYGFSRDCDSYQIVKIGGSSFEAKSCDCQHCLNDWDCCGNWFCSYATTKLGFIHFASYGLNV